MDDGEGRRWRQQWTFVATAIVAASACNAGEPEGGLTSFGQPGSGNSAVSDSSDGEGGSDEDLGSAQTTSGDGSGDDDPDGTDGGSTSGEGGGGDSTGPGRSTFNPIDDDGGDADGGAEQPDSGMWSSCDNGATCGGGLTCLGTDDMTMGVCSTTCSPAGNPASCGTVPGATAVARCLTVGGQSICALDCADGQTCPGGMACIAETDDTGAISICL